MQSVFNTIALVGKINNPETREPLLALAAYLRDQGKQVLVEAQTAQHLHVSGFDVVDFDGIGVRAELAVVLGGDGTMLAVARGLVDYDIPLIGVNRGRFGFLTDVSSDSMQEAIGQILNGEYTLEQRMLLGATVWRHGEKIRDVRAFNDVVVSKGSLARLIELEVAIDGEFVHSQRSDGLIVTTPTGTTAYALSAGGPLLHPMLEAIALVPVCPHTLSNRPFAINSSSVVEITIVHAADGHLHCDGQSHTKLDKGDKVVVKRLDKTITLLHPRGHSHYAMLRQKLNWG